MRCVSGVVMLEMCARPGVREVVRRHDRVTGHVVLNAGRRWVHSHIKNSWWTPKAGRLRCGRFATLSVPIVLFLNKVHMTTCNGRGGDDRVLACWLAVPSASTTTWYLQVLRKRNWSWRKARRFERIICSASVSEHVKRDVCSWQHNGTRIHRTCWRKENDKAVVF